LAPIPSDPVICWPPEPSLRAIIDDLRRLNPRLELRSETAVQGYEYLLHSGTSNDVSRIAFPQAASDDLLLTIGRWGTPGATVSSCGIRFPLLGEDENAARAGSRGTPPLASS